MLNSSVWDLLGALHLRSEAFMRRLFVMFIAYVLACGSSTSSSPTLPPGQAPADAGADSGTTCPQENEVVAVTGGCIRGSTSAALHTFYGVPYARPPVGELRWKPPTTPIAWTGVRDANVVSKACPQVATLVNGKTLEWDEDCLYLNVWTPSLDAGAKLPVMVWIHGGGLVNGSGGESIYGGQHLAEMGAVVVVTINYRLGQLGYLGHPALAAEQDGRSGNYGLLDQIAALKWVQANIGRFGGDSTRVTVFGESAGALSTCALIASPRAAGLFQRAVMESGGCPTYGTYVRPEKTSMGVEGSEEQGLRYATALGCGVDGAALACMRAKAPMEILSTLPAIIGVLSQGERYGFTVEGDTLTDTPDARTASDGFNRVPTLIGTNADEGTIFVAPLAIADEQAYGAYVRAAFPGMKGDAVLAQYPPSAYATPKAALGALVTDLVFACPARRKARDLTKYEADVYLYQFVQVPSYAKALGLGAFHGSEIDFVFGTLRDRTLGSATIEELALSDAMLGYWSRFARTGDPNGASVSWAKYDAAGDASLALAATIAPVTGLKMQKCDFWDSL